MLKAVFLAAALSSIVGASPSFAQKLSGVSILNIDGITESSLAAGYMSDARSTLVGEGAIVSDVGISGFSAASLIGVDILYVGLQNGLFNSAQISTIQDFVAGGGGLVAVGTERSSFSSPSYEQVANSFGLFGLGGDRDAKTTATDPSSAILNGPFGVATSYQPSATGAFDGAALPIATNVVWEGVDGQPIIVTLDVVGRAFFFADTNFMENGIIGGGDNRVIWGNAFAFTGNVGGVPEPATWTTMLVGFGIVGGALRSRRRTTKLTYA